MQLKTNSIEEVLKEKKQKSNPIETMPSKRIKSKQENGQINYINVILRNYFPRLEQVERKCFRSTRIRTY